jgi:hypothetical protein
MAEEREGASGEQRRKPVAALGERLGTDGVDRFMNPVEPMTSQSVFDRSPGESGIQELIECDDPVLLAGQVCDPAIELASLLTWAV